MRLPLLSPMSAVLASLCFSVPAFAADYALVTRDRVAEATARGGAILVDYGAVAWVRGSGLGADATETYALNLGGRTFSAPEDAAANQRVYGAAPALRLVQFDAPIRDEWLRDLAASGVAPIQYIGPFAYVVWARASDLDAAARAAHVRWSGDFLPEYKRVGADRALRGGETQWRATLYRGAAVGDAELRLAGSEPGSRRAIDSEFEIVGLRINDAAALERVSRLPGVFTVQAVPRDGGLRAEMMNQITANNLDGSNLPVPGFAAWLAGVGVNGAGVIIANVDGGVAETHPDLVGRFLSCTGSTCGGAASSQHGTHTAGIMAADGASGVLAAGFLRGQGMAPGANLVEQVYSPTFQQPGGMLELMKQSYDNNADLSGNSWGPAGSPLGYDGDTRQVDVGTRDTNATTPGDQPLTFVLSFMNGNGGTSTQGTPDEAKNIITVGSTKGQSSATAVIPAFNDLSSNTAHGPALDGRRIPHIVTPGCSVDSTVPGSYGLLCGTSMASPQVSGAVALFIDQYRDDFATDPSAALTKAAFIAAAQDLNGRLDADGGTLGHRPDNKQGWGRLRADWLLNGADPIVYFDQNTRTFDGTGESWLQSVSPSNAANPMKIVLTWTDAPGAGVGGATPAWVNNLDLVVTGSGGTYRGNVFAPSGFSATGGSADPSNNIEAVILDPAAAAGGVTISVVAANIAGNALPNSGDATDQDFALVCVNCITAPTFNVVTPTPRRDRCGPGDVNWTINVGALNGYTGNVALSAQGVPAPATTQFVPPTVAAGGSSTLTLSTGALADGVYDFNVTGDDGPTERSSTLTLGYNAALPPATTLTAPAAGATGVALAPTLQWSATGTGGQVESYLVELDDSPAFTSIDFSLETDQTQVTLTAPLQSETTYYWRVTTQNVCGSTPVAARSFTTVAVACTTFASTNVPQPIGATVAVSNVTVTGGVITDVDMPEFRGTHAYVNDVSATLASPGGTQVNVLAPTCGSQDNFNLAFDDESTRPAGSWPCPPTDALSYRPSNPLSAFDGQTAAGVWTLRITDGFPTADDGSLAAWSVRVCTEQTTPGTIFAHGFEGP